MATAKPRFSLTVSDEMLEEIEKYQRDNKISTRNKAIQRLVETGINDLKSTGAVPHETAKRSIDHESLDASQSLLLELYRKLNVEGQEKLLDYADDLVTSGKYIKNHPLVVGGEEIKNK